VSRRNGLDPQQAGHRIDAGRLDLAEWRVIA
jgi:hypothetical protein